MSDSTFASGEPGGSDRDEILSVLFAQMVLQLSQMATMLLGRAPNPQTGETVRDLEAARMFIDQLEMLEVKTKGNLSKDETNLLKQSLMTLRMAFVEAAGSVTTATTEAAPAESEKSATPESQSAAPAASAEDESKKKFTKKY
jgi:hypothetical protein